MKLITTFSEAGYNQYGKRWIDSVVKFWPDTTTVIIYTDFDLKKPADNFIIKNFDLEFPNHQQFKQLIFSNFNKNEKSTSIANKTIKFSYKGFVICKELIETTEGYLIWLDGDAETINDVTDKTITDILGNTSIACQQEKNFQHVESGVLFFNTLNTSDFAKEINEYYFNQKLLKLKKPYDGYIIADILKNKKYAYTDLNAGFNFQDKKSKKEDTFLHPLLKEHFVHWIGTAKV